MPYITVGQENSASIDLYYEDHGQGSPVVLIHGWPLSGQSWEKQVAALLEAGYRVITYDRRGFGKSDKPVFGYDYDTLAEDLHKLTSYLELEGASLVGFSMGGGEVARYVGNYGSKSLSSVAFISAVTPFLLKTSDNLHGVDKTVFDEIKTGLTDDRPAFLGKFLSNFYDVDVFRGDRVSYEVIYFSWAVAVNASPKGTLDCVDSWLTDFRDDLSRVDVPALVIHGTADRIIPFSSSGKLIPEVVKGCRLVMVDDAPHGLIWTHADQANRELLDFLAAAQKASATGREAA